MSFLGSKKSKGYGKWFVGNPASVGAAGASLLLLVYSLFCAHTRLADDAKSAKNGGACRFRHLKPQLHHYTFSFPRARVHHDTHTTCRTRFLNSGSVSAVCTRTSNYSILSPKHNHTYTFGFLYSLPSWSDLLSSRSAERCGNPIPHSPSLKWTPSGSQRLFGENPLPTLENTTALTDRPHKSCPHPPVCDDESNRALIEGDDEPVAGTSV